MATIREYSPDEAQKRYESLPRDVKDAIYSANRQQVLTSIGEKNHLHLDQLQILDEEVDAVMLGFTEPQDFPGIIDERLGLGSTVAGEIAQELDAALFQKIRESLKKMTAPVVEAKEPTAPAAFASAPTVPSAPITPAPAPKMPGLAEKMFSGTTSSVPKTVDLGAPSAPAPASQPPARKYEIDPYREPTN